MNTCAEADLHTAQLRDQRLSRRLIHLVDAWAAPPTASVPHALGRWRTALAATADALPADRTVITVADREADCYDLFTAPRRPHLHLRVRAKGRRRLAGGAGLLGAAVQGCPVQAVLRVTLPRRPDQ